MTTGFAAVYSLDPNDGKEVWMSTVSAPVRGAPLVFADRVFAISIDNKLQALAAVDGSELWQFTGLTESAGYVGGNSPAGSADYIVAPFSSGELVGLRVDNGRPVWNETMIGARGEVRAFGNLTDIRGRPVIDRGLVLAMGTAGQLAAVELRSGQRVWERDIGGNQTPWTAGRFVFVTTASADVAALDARRRQDQMGDAAHAVPRRGAQAAGPVVGPGAGRRPPADRRHARRASGRLALHRRDPGQDGSARPDPARAGDRQPHDLRLDRLRAAHCPPLTTSRRSQRVAIVGRPNVGKSTLFNRLVGKRRAIVDDTPGVTRDVREAPAQLGDLAFTLLDTAGWETTGGEALEARMRRFTERAIDSADAVLFLIDARAGVVPLDESFAGWLRKRADKVIVVANKCEGRAGQQGLAEAHALGLGDPIPVSAEHGEGLSDLHEALARYIEPMPEEDEEAEGNEEDDAVDPKRPLLLAIVGRPNVGKSTLLNRLVGEERVLTGPEAGITRDAIRVEWEWKGRAVRLVDTAGMRRRSRIDAKLEAASVADTLDTIRLADVVVVVLDAADMADKQDLTIAGRVIDEGRALVIAVNKTDLLADDQAGASRAWRKLTDRLEASFAQVKDVPIVGFSALNGRGIDRLMPAVFTTYDVWNKRVPTPKLNRWLREMETLHPPPLAKGRRIRLRFMTQIKRRPPTFVLQVSQPEELGDDYLRYLMNRLRDDFGLPGVPIRLTMRKSKNPFASRSTRR